MKQLIPVAVLVGALMVTGFAGCGGGGSDGRGSIGIAVIFPPRDTVSTAGTGMPDVTESLRVEVARITPDGAAGPDGWRREEIINRPAHQTVARCTIDGVPAGDVRISVTCFDGRGATGNAVARASSVETVVADRVTEVRLVTDRLAARVGIYPVPMPGGDPEPLSTITLEPREDLSVQARGWDYDGTETVYVDFGWTVAPPSAGLTLDPTTGSIIRGGAHEDGEYTVAVTDAMSGQSYELEVAVVSRAPAEVELSPRQATLWRFGDPEQVQLNAIVRDTDGQEIPYAELVWASSDADVASVGADGLVTAEGPGFAIITARGITATGLVEATCEIEVIDRGSLDVIVE